MINYVKQLDKKIIKKFIKHWTAQNHSDSYTVLFKFEDSNENQINVEAKIYDGLFGYLFSDYWKFDDFYAMVNTPPEIKFIRLSWQQYVLKYLKQKENDSIIHEVFNSKNYTKNLSSVLLQQDINPEEHHNM